MQRVGTTCQGHGTIEEMQKVQREETLCCPDEETLASARVFLVFKGGGR